MKQIYIICGVLFISLLTIYILFNTSIIQPHPSSIENKREQQTNTISYGLKDNQTNILTMVVQLLVRIIKLM